jgi:hypothetical protein
MPDGARCSGAVERHPTKLHPVPGWGRDQIGAVMAKHKLTAAQATTAGVGKHGEGAGRPIV